MTLFSSQTPEDEAGLWTGREIVSIRSQSHNYSHVWTKIRIARLPTAPTLTAFTEDAIALGGAALALVGITLSRLTGNHVYDAASAALIGLLLMGFALALAWENKRLLLGESAPPAEEASLRAVVADRPEVVHVDRLRTMYVGPEELLVVADVSFDPDLDTGDVDAAIDAIEADLRGADDRIRIVYVEPEV